VHACSISIQDDNLLSSCYVDTGSETVCAAETDTTWSIRWPRTTNGSTAVQKCPGGPNAIGKDNTFAKLFLHTTFFHYNTYYYYYSALHMP